MNGNRYSVAIDGKGKKKSKEDKRKWIKNVVIP